MSIFGQILSAPVRLVSAVAAVANIATEAVLGDNLDIFDVEESTKALAEEIKERA